MTTESTEIMALGDLSNESVASYRRDGFVRIRGLLTPQEAAEAREAARTVVEKVQDHAAGTVTQSAFTQLVNAWLVDEAIARVTLHPKVSAAAEALTGVRMRLWHDHMLIKQPGKSTPTEFHQDQPYWPHRNSPDALNCWIALNDVTVDRGCMRFIAGYHDRDDLSAQNLTDPNDLFNRVPEMAWAPQVALPLRAGDCTFHHGRTPHAAGANITEEPRFAHVVCFINEATRYDPSIKDDHVATRGRDLMAGEVIDGPYFPTTRDIIAGTAAHPEAMESA